MTRILKTYPLTCFFAIAIATSFFGFTMLEYYPSDWWMLLLFGPFVGALMVIAAEDGRTGVRTWLGRILRWRAGWLAYAFALGVPVLLQSLALAVNLALGAPTPTAAQWSAWPDALGNWVFIFLFIGLAEEPGFRGFATDRLLTRHSAVRASAIFGVLHVVWHLPLFFYGLEPPVIIPIILAGAFLMTWLYQRSNGSVLLTMMLHATVNTTAGFFGGLLPEEFQYRQTAILAVVYVLAAGILVLRTGPTLKSRAV